MTTLIATKFIINEKLKEHQWYHRNCINQDSLKISLTIQFYILYSVTTCILQGINAISTVIRKHMLSKIVEGKQLL